MVWKLLLALLGFSLLVLGVAELESKQAGAVPAAPVALDPLDPTSPAYDPRALLEHLKAEKAREDSARGPDGLTPGARSLARIIAQIAGDKDRDFMRLFAQRLRTDSSLRNEALDAGIDLSLDGPELASSTKKALELLGRRYHDMPPNFLFIYDKDPLYLAWKERGSPVPQDRR